MRRGLLFVLVAAIAGAAALLPQPPPPPQPLAGLIIDAPGIESPDDAGIWYCPWAQSNAERDSTIGVVSLAPAEAEMTFPVAIPGEPPDKAETATLGPGAATVVLSEVAQRGDSPGFIEFSDGPAAAAVTIGGDVTAADTCVASGPDEWFFAGGSTLSGERLRLRLFNPFPETAKVTVAGFSEIGTEALGELRSISVNPRSWRDIDFEEMLRQRQALVMSVRVEEGLVVPAMSFGSGDDEAWWMGTGLSETWELPVTRSRGVESTIVIGNPGTRDVQVTVDLYMEDQAMPAAFTQLVSAGSPLRIGLGEVGPQVLAARVSADGPIVAAVVAVGENGTAVTSGVPATSRTWLVPGARSEGPEQGMLWVLNSSDEPVSVTVTPLTGGDAVNTSFTIDPARMLQIPVADEEALGFVVSSPDFISVGWTVTAESGTAYAPGLAVDDE